MANGFRRWLGVLACFVPFLLGCHNAPPFAFEPTYQDALRKFNQGDFKPALAEINLLLAAVSSRQTEDLWRLRLLKAEILIWQEDSRGAVRLLMPAAANELPRDLAARRLVLLGLAYSNLQQLQQADDDFSQAERLNQPQSPATTCGLLLGQGKVAAIRGQFSDADQMFRQALAIARHENNPLSATNAMGNLGVLNMRQKHYADAVDWFNASLNLAKSQKEAAPTVRLIGNLGWAYLEMGDLDRAADNFAQAASMSRQNAMVGDEETWLSNMGAVELLQRNLPQSQRTFERALELARSLENRQDVIYNINDLAKLAVLQKQPDVAERLNREAFSIEKAIGDHDAPLYSDLNEALIASATGHPETAVSYLRQILSGKNADVSLKAEALGALAKLEDEQGHVTNASRLFDQGTTMLDKAQQALGRPEFQLSYPTNAQGIYDDYIHFLVKHGMQNHALSVVETHRARTLLAGTKPDPRLLQSASWSPAAMKAATREDHIVLTYWLGQGNSYLWLVSSHAAHMAALQDQDQIVSMVQRYQARLTSSFGASPLDSSAGQELYELLVGPVKQWIPPGASITIIPDGVLCGLNFETLAVPSPKPHYWIEDASLNVANSMAMVGQTSKARASSPSGLGERLLVVGDPKTPGSYPELSHAHDEVSAVAKHFSKGDELLLTGAKATPSAYFAAKPQDYAIIHFVAHGTASRVSPLDSAVVLSDDGKSYNLFARQIMSHPIHARLVTISACDSAGNRVYSAEGLVGMSWAFLHAGAHEVVAALWEVNDASIPHFMDLFYAEVAQGDDPALALRDAKLDMLHSGTIYAKPFYWAPFVLYEGQ